jgi:hypothetical protein
MIRIAANGEDLGEVSEDEAQRKIAEGKLDANAFFWRDGMSEWRPIAEFIAASPPPLPITDLAAVAIAARPLTDEYHQAQVAAAREKLESLMRSAETFPEEIDEAAEELTDAIQAAKERREERDEIIKAWIGGFHKDSIEAGESEDLLPYLKVYKKPTEAQIRAMSDHCERVLNATLTEETDEFFSLYEKLFPDARKASKSRGQARQPKSQSRSIKKKRGGCYGLFVATVIAVLALAAIAMLLRA